MGERENSNRYLLIDKEGFFENFPLWVKRAQ